MPRWAAEGMLAFGAGAVALVVALLTLGIGIHNWSLPWAEGDMLMMYSFAENMSRGHWFLHNPDLGFPGFQDQGHYPIPDLIPMALIALIVQVAPTAISAVNLFSAFTFFSVAFVTTATFRLLGVGRLAAFAAGFCFSVLPWHFNRAGGPYFWRTMSQFRWSFS